MGLADDIKTHAAASLAAGTMATTLCAPADVIKSRLQSSAGKEVGTRKREKSLPCIVTDGICRAWAQFFDQGCARRVPCS